MSGDDLPAPSLMPASARRLLGFAFVFSIFANILMLTGPLFMLQVYDRVLTSRSEETLVALVALVLMLYGLMWLLDFARARLVARIGARFQAAQDEGVFSRVLSDHGGADRDKTLTAIRDVEHVQGFSGSPAATALMDVPFTPLFIVAIFAFHPWLGWFALSGGLALIAITAVNQGLTARKVAQAQRTGELAHRLTDQARRAAEVIRSQGMAQAVTRRWIARRAAALEQTMGALDWTNGFATFSKAFRLALQSLVLALGAWLVLRQEMSAGAMIAASILLGRALAPIEQIIGRWPQIVRARQGYKTLASLAGSQAMPGLPTRLPMPVGQLDVAHVTLRAAHGRAPLIYDLSFSLEPGTALGVIGRSGAGKTTLARVALGLIEPSVGEVRLGGALIAQYAPEDLGRAIGYLPQDPSLLPGTISENIARMALEPDASQVITAAQKAGVHDLILSLPDGYDTVIGPDKSTLSGGERQRIALARAFYGDPVVLVLDEPNSALDQDGSAAMNAAVAAAKSDGTAVIIMTHRPMAIAACDRLMVLDHGRISALGPRDEILKSFMKNADGIQRVIGGAG